MFTIEDSTGEVRCLLSQRDEGPNQQNCPRWFDG